MHGRRQRPRLKLVYFDDFAPYSWRDEQGKMRGLMIDVMDRVAAQMGLRVRHEGYPWQRAQKLVRMAQTDGFVTIATRERRSYTLVVEEPVTTTVLTVFTRLGHPRMTDFQRANRLNDFKSFAFLDYFGNGRGKENLAGFTVHHTINVDNVFKMLAAGRGAAAACLYSVQSLHWQTLPLQYPNHRVQQGLVTAVAK